MKGKEVVYGLDESALDEFPKFRNVTSRAELIGGATFYRDALGSGLFDLLPSHLKNAALREAFAFFMASSQPGNIPARNLIL